MLSGTPEDWIGAQEMTAGVDEAGRGPLAGPVVAAAVVLGKSPPAGLADSKTLSAKKRAALEPQIKQSCAWGVGIVDVSQIDRINIFAATMLAMSEAVLHLQQAMGAAPAQVLVDGNMTPAGRCDMWSWPARAIVGGDGIEPAISAASIIAKEWRDRVMRDAAEQYPEYGWGRNKGYGTKEHLAALRQYGPTPLHRRSFAPVAQLSLI